MKVSKSILLLILIMCLVFCYGCKDEDLRNETQPSKITEVMSAHTTVEIIDVSNCSDFETVADVQITMPDVNKIYMDLLSNGKANTMTVEDISLAISEYAVEEDFQLNCNTTAMVEKSGDEWVLSSEESINVVIKQQVDDLLVQMINNIEVIEIEGGSE